MGFAFDNFDVDLYILYLVVFYSFLIVVEGEDVCHFVHLKNSNPLKS